MIGRLLVCSLFPTSSLPTNLLSSNKNNTIPQFNCIIYYKQKNKTYFFFMFLNKSRKTFILYISLIKLYAWPITFQNNNNNNNNNNTNGQNTIEKENLHFTLSHCAMQTQTPNAYIYEQHAFLYSPHFINL